MKHRTATQHGLGITEEKGEQSANWESVFMYSPSLEQGKREGQLPLVQVPIVHSAWQLSWVLDVAKSTECKKSASANTEGYYIAQEKTWNLHLYEERGEKKPFILQFSARFLKGTICLQLSC